jgi:hypothetical protein
MLLFSFLIGKLDDPIGSIEAQGRKMNKKASVFGDLNPKKKGSDGQWSANHIAGLINPFDKAHS